MKRKSNISIVACILLATGLCGCASNSGQKSQQSSQPAAQTATTTQSSQPAAKPKKDKRPIEERLAVGMTMDEVKTACGNPKNVSMNSDGSAVWMYDNGQNAFIPYYTLSGGKIHHVTIIFDSNGKVKSWSSASTGMY
jgi:hypothetical protein